MNDYVEFRGGHGLDTQLMQIGDDVCGFRPFPCMFNYLFVIDSVENKKFGFFFQLISSRLSIVFFLNFLYF